MNHVNVVEASSCDMHHSSISPTCLPNMVHKEFQGNGLKIAQLNINSILKHIDEVKALVKYNDIHLLALNEKRKLMSLF